MRSLTVALALSLTVLAGCSNGDEQEDAAALSSAEVDEATAAWQADVEEELGTDTFDFDALQRNTATDCERTTADAWTISLALDGATSTSNLTRIGLQHACDEVVAAFDEGLAAVEAADDTTALACSLPREAAAAEDQPVLAMVCQG